MILWWNALYVFFFCCGCSKWFTTLDSSFKSALKTYPWTTKKLSRCATQNEFSWKRKSKLFWVSVSSVHLTLAQIDLTSFSNHGSTCFNTMLPPPGFVLSMCGPINSRDQGQKMVQMLNYLNHFSIPHNRLYRKNAKAERPALSVPGSKANQICSEKNCWPCSSPSLYALLILLPKL